MINQSNLKLGLVRSSIRELFEYGKKRKSEIGEENVFDFSLGNPSVPTPNAVSEELKEIIDTIDPVILHGYTSAQGDYSVRKALVSDLERRYNAKLLPESMYLTCGAAASLTITLNALINRGDEVIAIKPYFPEYKVFVENAGGVLIGCNSQKDTFKIDIENIRNSITSKTKAIIINSPNNPTGVVYSKPEIEALSRLLDEKFEQCGQAIYLISDEPYRELIFDETVYPFVTNYYDRSIVSYSFSKSLSLPGERIGYIAVNPKMEEWNEVYAAVCGAGRSLGFVCAPNLFQQLIARVCSLTSDISVYKNNRNTLMSALEEYGYTVVKPDGAFYLFVKSLEENAADFCERAKNYEILLVAGDDFGAEGYVRIAYCVSPEMINKSLPAFKQLAETYKTNS